MHRAHSLHTLLLRCFSSAAGKSRVPPTPTPGSLAPFASPPPPALNTSMIAPQLDRMDGLTTIVGHDKYGFNISGVFMRGSVLVFPRYTLLWNVAKAVDVSPRSMAPFHMMNPKPELVIVGTGLGAYSNINPACYAYLSRKGISLEVMNITNAIYTFNLLMEEGRNVAAALVSLEPMSRLDASLFTDEALDHLVTPRDVVNSKALALDYLPKDKILLTDGSLHPTSSNALHADRATPQSHPSVGSTTPPPTHTRVGESQPTGYGVPGGVSPAPSLVPDGEQGQEASHSTIRPNSEAQLLSNVVERGKRKSGLWDGGGERK